MSKASIEFEFDRKNRMYTPGEKIRGTVIVHAIHAVTFKEFTLERFWATHGRGDLDTGGHETQVLARGGWHAGKLYRYPFSFWAPDGPPTYHGHYLNIDHYVQVRADVPWAFDPKARAEFLIRPRPGSQPPAVSRLVAATKGSASGCSSLVWGAVFFFVFVFGLTQRNVIGPLIAVAVLAIGLYFGARMLMKASAYGTVKLKGPHGAVAPGQTVPLQLRFVPSRSYKIASVVARLTGKEVCSSGSGTNRSTKRHTFFDQRFRLAGERQVYARKAVEVEGTLEVPETDAFSFDAADNKILWSMELRIDAPKWPDWSESWDIEVSPPAEILDSLPEPEPEPAPEVVPGLPAAFTGLAPEFPAIQSETTRAEQEPPDEDEPEEPAPSEPREVEPPPDVEEDPMPEPAPREPAPAPPDPGDDAAERLKAVMQQVQKADRYTGARAKMIETLAGSTFRFALTVGRVTSTSAYDAPADYRRGRTVEGMLLDGKTGVAVRLPAAQNDAVAGLEAGDRIQVSGILDEYDDVFERAVLEGDLLPG